MEVGFALPQYDFSVPGEVPLRWATVEAWADRAVAVGFTSLWLSDHLFLSLEKYGGPNERFRCFDPITAIAALATRHPETTVGCLVFCAPLRAPKMLAKQVESLDELSPGRIVAGLGAGWYEPDFATSGVAMGSAAERLRAMVEAGKAVRAMAPRVPVWFGGRGDRLVELAVRFADGWNTVWAVTPDEYRVRLERTRALCDQRDRDPATFALSVGLATLVGEDEADVRRRWQRRVETAPAGMFDAIDFDTWRSERLVGTVEQVAEQKAQWEKLGVRLLIANLGALPFSVTDTDDLDLAASALL